MEPLIVIKKFLFYWPSRIAAIFLPEQSIVFLKIFSAVISVVLFIGIVFLFIRLNIVHEKTEKFTDFFRMPNISRRKSIRAWQQILRRLSKNNEAQNKMAIIEADKIFSEILKQMGYRGETVADQLKMLTSTQLSNIEDVWQAHKVRNKIVHEPDFKLNNFEAQAVIDIYHQTFKELGLIE